MPPTLTLPCKCQPVPFAIPTDNALAKARELVSLEVQLYREFQERMRHSWNPDDEYNVLKEQWHLDRMSAAGAAYRQALRAHLSVSDVPRDALCSDEDACGQWKAETASV